MKQVKHHRSHIRKGILIGASVTLMSVSFMVTYFFSPLEAQQNQESSAFIANARKQIGITTQYDGSYRKIPYPGGDVPQHIGVCTDVVIRAFRSQGIDLQQLVHEDMVRHFDNYPSQKIWGLRAPDKNIDHRRVPNLVTFFSRKGSLISRSPRPRDLKPGDIVTWMLPGNLPHIGIVSDLKAPHTDRFLIIHNIGSGVREEDMLLHFPITGQFRYPIQNE